MSVIVPIITIDGPSGVGKGTLAIRLALHLRWHYLDSGALYRIAALIVNQLDMTDLSDISALLEKLERSSIKFGLESSGKVNVLLNDDNVGESIRTEEVAAVAAKLAKLPVLRAFFLEYQRTCASSPGLVTDGRDMGSVVFPEAPVKIFLDASVEERAERRYKQLVEKGVEANLKNIENEMTKRDLSDKMRKASPLVCPSGAKWIDSTLMSQEDVFQMVLSMLKEKGYT